MDGQRNRISHHAIRYVYIHCLDCGNFVRGVAQCAMVEKGAGVCCDHNAVMSRRMGLCDRNYGP